jgi:hypothetical protein
MLVIVSRTIDGTFDRSMVGVIVLEHSNNIVLVYVDPAGFLLCDLTIKSHILFWLNRKLLTARNNPSYRQPRVQRQRSVY